MQHQRPFLQHTALGLLPLEAHLQAPGSPRVLTPGVGGHEGPLVEAHLGVIVAGPPAEQNGLGAHWRAHVDVEVAAAAGVDRHYRLDVLQVAHKVVLALAGVGADGQHQLVARLDFAGGKQKHRITSNEEQRVK